MTTASHRAAPAIAIAIALSISGAACSSSGSAHAANTTTPTTSVRGKISAPPGDLYRPPDPLPAGRPGLVIWAQRVEGINFSPPQTVWRFLYHSRDENNRDVAVSAYAIVPKAAAPKHGRAVYAWAHGTAGLGDQCAPSKSIRENLPPYAGEVENGNALVVATDYEGLGTPGAHTYLAGRPEGQAVLDSVRAAATLPGSGPVGSVVLAGQSQGGGAALFAAQLAPSYAPELPLRGVLASAPAAELTRVATADMSSSNKGLLLLAASGLHAADPKLSPQSFLTPAAVADLARVQRECVDATVARYQDRPASDVVTVDPSSVTAVARVLDENSPGGTRPRVPIMIVQGDRDEQIPVAVSGDLAAEYCALHATVFRRVYSGASHDGVLDAAHADAVAWLNARFEGQPAPSNCTG